LLSGRRRGLGRRHVRAGRGQVHAVTREDPVRVCDAGVVGPDLGPLPWVVKILAADVPQRVALAHDVDGRHVRVLDSASSLGAVALAAAFALDAEYVRDILLVGDHEALVAGRGRGGRWSRGP